MSEHFMDNESDCVSDFSSDYDSHSVSDITSDSVASSVSADVNSKSRKRQRLDEANSTMSTVTGNSISTSEDGDGCSEDSLLYHERVRTVVNEAFLSLGWSLDDIMSPKFTEMCQVLNCDYLPRDRHSLLSDIVDVMFPQYRHGIMKILQMEKAQGATFCLGLDVRNVHTIRKSYIATALSYCNSKFESVKMLLDFAVLPYPHSDNHIKQHLLSTLKEFDILDRVLTITLNNDPSRSLVNQDIQNDAALNLLFPEFLQYRFLDQLIHILAGHAVEFAKPALKKVKKILKRLKIPNQQLLWEAAILSETPHLVSTDRPKVWIRDKWNTVFESLRLFVQYELAINKLLLDGKSENLISQDEYSQLTMVADFLEKLTTLTLSLSKPDGTPTIHSSHEQLAYLLKHVVRCQAFFPIMNSNAALSVCGSVIDSARSMLLTAEKFLSEYTFPDVYCICHLIDARNKDRFIAHVHGKDSLEFKRWMSLIQGAYLRFVAKMTVALTSACTADLDGSNSAAFVDSDADLTAFAMREANNAAALSDPLYELNEYFSEPCHVSSIPDNDYNPLVWWEAKQTMFPQLSQFARSFLAIENRAVQVDSVFTEARRHNNAGMSAKATKAVILSKSYIATLNDSLGKWI